MRNPEKGKGLRETVEKEKQPVSILALDVNSDESVAHAISTIRSQTECPDVLVNNAGIEAMGSVEELPLEAFRVTLETNYFGALRCIKACLPATPPSLVAEKIRVIIESGTSQLRHPVGPDAQPFLSWRQSMADEEWVNWGAMDDEAWYERFQKDFGVDARPKKAQRSAGA